MPKALEKTQPIAKVRTPKTKPLKPLKTYTYKVVLERDEEGWAVYAPALESKGGATWGRTRGEALVNIQDALEGVARIFLEDGEPLPLDKSNSKTKSRLRVSVTPIPEATA